MTSRRMNPIADDLNPKTYEDFARVADAILRAYSRADQAFDEMRDKSITLSNGARFAGRAALQVEATLVDEGLERGWKETEWAHTWIPGASKAAPTQNDFDRLKNFCEIRRRTVARVEHLETLLKRLAFTAEVTNGVDFSHLSVWKDHAGTMEAEINDALHDATSKKPTPDYFSSKPPPKKIIVKRRKNPLADDLNPKTYDDFARVADGILASIRENRTRIHMADDVVLSNGVPIPARSADSLLATMDRMGVEAGWMHDIGFPGATSSDVPPTPTFSDVERLRNAAKRLTALNARVDDSKELIRRLARKAYENGVSFDHLTRVRYGGGPATAADAEAAAFVGISAFLQEGYPGSTYFAANRPPKPKKNPNTRMNPLADDLDPKTYKDFARVADAILAAAGSAWRAVDTIAALTLSNGVEIPANRAEQLLNRLQDDGLDAGWIDFCETFTLNLTPRQTVTPTANDVARLRNVVKLERGLTRRVGDLEKLLRRLVQRADENGVSVSHLPGWHLPLPAASVAQVAMQSLLDDEAYSTHRYFSGRPPPAPRKNPAADDLNPKTYADFARSADAILAAAGSAWKNASTAAALTLSNGMRLSPEQSRYLLARVESEGLAAGWRSYCAMHPPSPPRKGLGPPDENDIARLRNAVGLEKSLKIRAKQLGALLERVVQKAHENGVPLTHLGGWGAPNLVEDVTERALQALFLEHTYSAPDYFSQKLPWESRKNPAKVPDALNPRTARQLIEIGKSLYTRSDEMQRQAMDMRIDVRPNREHPNERLILRGYEIPKARFGDANTYTPSEMAIIQNAAKKYEFCANRAREYGDMFDNVAELAKRNGVIFDPSLPAVAAAEGVILFEKLLSGDKRTARRRLIVL